MSAQNTTTYVLVDLASLTLVGHAGHLTATLTPTKEQLAERSVNSTVNGPLGARDRLELLDEVLATARVYRAGSWHPLALYDPHTAQVSVGPTPTTAAYSFDVPVTFDAAGALVNVTADQLRLGEAVAVRVEAGEQDLRAAAHAHLAV